MKENDKISALKQHSKKDDEGHRSISTLSQKAVGTPRDKSEGYGDRDGFTEFSFRVSLKDWVEQVGRMG